MIKRILTTLMTLSFLLGLALWQQQPSVAAMAVPPTVSFPVNTTDDTADATPGDGICADANGNCSLRAAIGEANALAGDNTITFNLPAGPNTINLTGALPNITDSLTITGPGAKLLTVRRDTGGNYRIFNITAPNLNITISGLTITNGKPTEKLSSGGGIQSSSNLTLTDCAIVGNEALVGGGGVVLTVANGTFTGCTFSGNTAGSQGGGVYYAGVGRTTLRLSNCTISGNTTNFSGGSSILNQAFLPNANGQGTMEVINCTIADNTSSGTDGGGIHTQGAITRLRNSIIANNTAPNLISSNDPAHNVPGVVTSLGHNLTSDNGGGFLTEATDKISTDPLLGLLLDNGGPTKTHALTTDSPAINKGNNCVLTNTCPSNNLGFNLTTDQRGVARPFPTDGIVDIGAFEVSNFSPTINSMAVTRTAGSPASSSQIATVNDAEDEENALTVTATLATGSGVTVNSISVDSSGNVTANVAAACSATTSTFTLQVTDSGGSSAQTTLTITVTATPPTLSYSNNPGTQYGTALTVNPLSGPSDDVAVNSVSVQSIMPTNPGGITVNSNGVVSVASTVPAGTYTVTIRAVDNCGGANGTTDASFTLGIVRAPLTVTVNNAWRNQGEANPPFSGTVTGVLNNDGITASYGTTATTGSAPGTYPITATLNDPNNRLGNYQVMNNPGSLTILNSCGIVLSPASFLQASLGLPFAQALSASPSGTYSFSLFAGPLPPGLQLVNNAGYYSLYGTPTTPGTFTFTLRTQRSGSTCEAIRTYTMTIAPTVVPKVTCKTQNANGSYTVRFGYENSTGAAVTIPVGANNSFASGAADRGQTTVFQPGVVTNAFSVTFANAGHSQLGI